MVQVLANIFSFMTDSFADVEKRYPTDSLNATGTNMYGSIKQLYLHKKKNRQMKTLLSVGGWTYSPTFPNATSTEATRAEFVRSAVKLVTDHGFDGLDIDWEYPTNAVEATNFVSLVKALREGFDAHSAAHASGYHFLITAATSAGPLKYNILKLGEMNKYVDKFFLMAYEYSGAFSNFTGHDANLYLSKKNPTSTEFDTQSAIAGYLAAGVTPSKLVMGMPLYGKSFLNTDGLGKTYNGTGPGSWEAGIWDYKALPKVGAIEHYAHEVVGSFSYDNATRELISYDTVKSVTAKSDYIMEKGLGGAMFWESSMDKTGNQSLLGATQSALANLDQSQNLLDYSTSPYANLVAGMPNE
ncbi:Chitinase 4 [Ciborinia camelliae]|nr:Chitinase 4 [Ciborinia camelliae]